RPDTCAHSGPPSPVPLATDAHQPEEPVPSTSYLWPDTQHRGGWKRFHPVRIPGSLHASYSVSSHPAGKYLGLWWIPRSPCQVWRPKLYSRETRASADLSGAARRWHGGSNPCDAHLWERAPKVLQLAYRYHRTTLPGDNSSSNLRELPSAPA